jgi:hypothetical protein
MFKLISKNRKPEVKLKILSGIHQAQVLVPADAHWAKPVSGDDHKPTVMLSPKSNITHLSRFIMSSLHVFFWKQNSGLCFGSGYPMFYILNCCCFLSKDFTASEYKKEI